MPSQSLGMSLKGGVPAENAYCRVARDMCFACHLVSACLGSVGTSARYLKSSFGIVHCLHVGILCISLRVQASKFGDQLLAFQPKGLLGSGLHMLRTCCIKAN